MDNKDILYKKLKKLEGEIHILKDTQSHIVKKIAVLKNQEADLIRRIKNTEEVKVIVSDHAIVRFLERKFDLNIENVVKEILNKEVVNNIIALGGSGKFTHDYLTIVVKKYNVVTVY